MIEKIILFGTFFLGASPWVLAQSLEHSSVVSDLQNKVAMLSVEAQSISPDEYTAIASTQPTAKPLPTASFALHRQGSSLLIHLKGPSNQVALQVTDAVGSLVKTSSKTGFSSGFYELPVLSDHAKPGIYTVKLFINEQVITLRTVK